MIMRERRVNVMLPGRNTEEIRIFMEMSSTINNWEDTLREKEIRLRKEDQERNLRIERAKSLKGIWDLMRICKEYLAEWGTDWRVGIEKNEERRSKGKILEKEIRMEKIKEKKITFEKRKLQFVLNFKIKKLGNGGKIEWER